MTASAAQPLNLIALETDQRATMAIRAATADGHISLLGIVVDLATLTSAVSEKRPGVVLLDLALVGADVTTTVRTILSSSPESCIVVTGADVSPATISRAVSAGARAFLLRPFEASDLAATIRDAHANLGELRRLQRSDIAPTRSRGTVVAVYSPKGGVGCTTIATNLAVALSARSKKRVAVVDLDLQFGDVGVALDLRSANSVIELVAHDDQLDASLVEDVFLRHESGIRVLVAPEQVGAADSVDPARIVHAVEALRDHFAFTVCDLWSSLDDLTLGVLRAADQVLLVTTPELPSLKNLRRAMAATPLLGDDRTQIVLNRHPGKAGVSVADVEKNLGRRVSSTIPSEGIGITDAINQGISMFDSRARVRVSQSYVRLADALLREADPRKAGQIITAARA